MGCDWYTFRAITIQGVIFKGSYNITLHANTECIKIPLVDFKVDANKATIDFDCSRSDWADMMENGDYGDEKSIQWLYIYPVRRSEASVEACGPYEIESYTTQIHVPLTEAPSAVDIPADIASCMRQCKCELPRKGNKERSKVANDDLSWLPDRVCQILIATTSYGFLEYQANDTLSGRDEDTEDVNNDDEDDDEDESNDDEDE